MWNLISPQASLKVTVGKANALIVAAQNPSESETLLYALFRTHPQKQTELVYGSGSDVLGD